MLRGGTWFFSVQNKTYSVHYISKCSNRLQICIPVFLYIYKVKQEIIYTYIYPRPNLGNYNITPDNQAPWHKQVLSALIMKVMPPYLWSFCAKIKTQIVICKLISTTNPNGNGMININIFALSKSHTLWCSGSDMPSGTACPILWKVYLILDPCLDTTVRASEVSHVEWFYYIFSNLQSRPNVRRWRHAIISISFP